jgi:hypothetical protein
VSWSADGARLASAAGDETVRVWDARSGACLEVIRGSQDLRPFVSPDNTAPWRAEIRRLETVVVPTAEGQTIACFPQTPMGMHLSIDPSGRTWVCGISNYVCLFTLEGNPDQPAS